MKRFLFALLGVVGLLMTSVGPVQARTGAPNDYVAYLPFAVNPPCSGYIAHQYASVNEPVVRVGEPFTITGVLVNDGCTWFVHLVYVARIYSPSGEVGAEPQYPGINVGPQQENRIQWTFTLTTTGEYTVTTGSSFLAELPQGGPGMWGGAGSSPVVIRVLAD